MPSSIDHRRKNGPPAHGKQPHHKIKPYVVLQYLLKYSDENHPQTAMDICAYLAERGIYTERRSIYNDIKEINAIALMMEEECEIEEANQMLDDDEDGDLKLIIYDKSKKGFYVRQRHFDLNDIRLLAECVYSSKFIAEKQAKRLVNVVCDYVSEYKAEKIKHNAFLTDRIKTSNNSVLNIISLINEAMNTKIDGSPHTPEKISFKYLTYSISDIEKPIERRKGARYTVSPFQLLINDGNYYLLAFDDKEQDLRTYRVDRMKDVRYEGVPREGKEIFEKIDLKTYTQRVFSMYTGDPQLVRIRFINPLLNAIVDRFGTKEVQYAKADDKHFSITARVEISDQFFGWLLGFGNKAKILYPDSVITQFNEYLDKVKALYQ